MLKLQLKSSLLFHISSNIPTLFAFVSLENIYKCRPSIPLLHTSELKAPFWELQFASLQPSLMELSREHKTAC